jgi:serine/threonine protein kinase
LADFNLLCVIGKGSFGKVYLAHLKNDQQKMPKLYAIKAMKKI